ncbi:hypothetical protein [Kitasatospora sp. CB02891]|uniref:hypothetical protein n=1 Tax=Kitasatospora sp. CB02891 TaxID=2020329 RepID=UPI000C274E32|nr:hypothetical protein [Kitasatospora sp. CB02891]PJN29743.1 hypothetical protein CG736_04265 [Kitasatospora sp. CB02891]
MDLDRELSRMMEKSVEELCVPVAVIVAESKRRGRRLQLVRRLQGAGAALTVVAVVAAGANAALSGTTARTPVGSTGPAGAGVASATDPAGLFGRSSGQGESSPGPDRSPAFDVSAPPAPGRPSATGTPLSGGLLAFTPAQVSKTLGALLPADLQYLKGAENHPGSLPVGTMGVLVHYVDGTGEAASIEVTVRHSKAAFPTDRNAPVDPSALPFQCTETVLGNGARSVQGCHFGFLPDGTGEMVESNDAPVPGLYSHRVSVWRPDGTVLEFTEYNGLRDYTGGKSLKTRTEPPIPLAVWREVAESPDWHWFAVPKS